MWKSLKAVSNEIDYQLNDTPTSSPSPLAEMAMSWVGHFSVKTPTESMHTGNVHRNGDLMLHHLAGATTQVANLVMIVILQDDDDKNKNATGSCFLGEITKIRKDTQTKNKTHPLPHKHTKANTYNDLKSKESPPQNRSDSGELEKLGEEAQI